MTQFLQIRDETKHGYSLGVRSTEKRLPSKDIFYFAYKFLTQALRISIRSILIFFRVLSLFYIYLIFERDATGRVWTLHPEYGQDTKVFFTSVLE